MSAKVFTLYADVDCTSCEGKGINRRTEQHYGSDGMGGQMLFTTVHAPALCSCITSLPDTSQAGRIWQLEQHFRDFRLAAGVTRCLAKRALSRLAHARRERKMLRDLMHNQLGVKFK